MKTISKNQEKFIILIGISIGIIIGITILNSIKHYSKDNKSLTNIFDIEQCRNNIKNILLIQKEYISKYNYNYNFYRG